MCRICDGLSLDEVLALDAAKIAEHGYVLVGVDDSKRRGEEARPWVYTVGLVDAADHPEMIIAGVSLDRSAPLLSFLADLVIEGEHFDVGDTIGIGHGNGVVRVGAVNEVQYALSTFNMWHNQLAYGTLRTDELEAVQIILPSTVFCSVHGDAQPRLDNPEARVDLPLPRPNRAARRHHRPGRRSA